MYVLQCGDFSDIISWTDNGLAFKVESALKLEDTVLPAIFKDAKFSSFRRKVRRNSEIRLCRLPLHCAVEGTLCLTQIPLL